MTGAGAHVAGGKFDQTLYWRRRHERFRGDPRSVGNLGKSLEENLRGERQFQEWVGHAARLLRPYRSVLDVGCGYGRAATAFCDAGYAYFGIDVSEVAIAEAREREPRGSFMVGSALDLPQVRKFDLVAAFYVLAHFVDDADWGDLMVLLIANLADGGGFLFADPFPDERLTPAPHVTLRPLTTYTDLFRSHAMRMDDRFRTELAAALGRDDDAIPFYLARKPDR
jgi:SAM-dependent methyltransferase